MPLELDQRPQREKGELCLYRVSHWWIYDTGEKQEVNSLGRDAHLSTGDDNDADPADPALPRLKTIAWEFLKIGATGFGGGVAVIALMQRQCVDRRRWLSAEEFLHGVSLGQILGSFAVNTAFFIGYRLRGLLGAIVAMCSFLAPSVIMVIGLSWIYFATQKIPSIQQAMVGASPVVIALIASAGTSLGTKALRGVRHDALACLGFAGTLYHAPLLELLGFGALIGIVLRLGSESNSDPKAPSKKNESTASASQAAVVAPYIAGASGTTATLTGKSFAATVATAGASLGLVSLILLFLKIGCGFFGGGYVLVPLLQHELVARRGLLSIREFLDGVAISQLTPGPIAVLATFVGYRFAGAAGAILATAALYLPATVLMTLLSHAYARLRHLQAVKHLLAGLGPVIVGMIFASAVQLAPHTSLSLSRPLGIILCAAAYMLLRRQLHPAFLLAAGALMGIAFPGAFVS